MRVRGKGPGLIGLATAVLLAPLPATAQAGGGQARESRVVREASGLEWRGRIQEAEALLEEFLAESPTSSAGLFALERVLRTQGRVGEVLPWADRYLEGDPSSSAVRYMKLRVLVDEDSLAALGPAADAWFAAEPGTPDPYREVARLYQRALGSEAALAVLEKGQETLSQPGVLALAVGDIRAEMGDGPGAAREWARALEDPDTEVGAVLRRVGGLAGDPQQLAPPLLDALAGGPTLEHRQAAVEVAIGFGMDDDAVELGRALLEELPPGERSGFLLGVATRAAGAERPVVALWALEEARRDATERERLGIDLQLASAALQAGDTARALRAQNEVARRLPAGSVERRQVMAELIRVQATTASAARLEDQLGQFEAEYPDAPETDELRATVAASLAGRGQVQEAREVASAGRGSLSALEEGYLRLQEGEVTAGMEALQQALGDLAPSKATEVLHLLSSLNRVGAQAAEPLGRAAARGHQGRPAEGSTLLTEALPGVPEEDRATVMAWAGELADQAGESGRAAELLTVLVQEYPDAPEFPEASLALAEIHRQAGRTAEARSVLEELILRRPESPVAPAARRALQRIREESAGEGGWMPPRPDPEEE